MPAKTLLSEVEFDALARVEGNKYELCEGEVIVTASARLFHNLVRDRLGESLAAYARERHLGAVAWETEFRLATATVRIPDLAFLRKEKLRALDVKQRAEGAPDIAVEVVSPSNDASDLTLKVQQYLQAGSVLVWVLYPQTRLVYIYRPGERPEIREDGQALDAPEMLPGWSLPLTELFNAARPR